MSNWNHSDSQMNLHVFTCRNEIIKYNCVQVYSWNINKTERLFYFSNQAFPVTPVFRGGKVGAGVGSNLQFSFYVKWAVLFHLCGKHTRSDEGSKVLPSLKTSLNYIFILGGPFKLRSFLLRGAIYSAQDLKIQSGWEQ